MQLIKQSFQWCEVTQLI